MRASDRPGALLTALLVAGMAASACGAGETTETSFPAPPTTTPTPTASPSDAPPSAAPSPSFEVIGERLAAGTHTARPFDPALPEPWGVCAGQSGCAETTADDSIGITYTVPEGWAFGFRAAVTKPSAGTVAPSGMSLHFLRGGWLFTDPCLKVDTLPDIEVGPTADDFADALAAHPLLDVTTPADVTLGGYSGKYLDLQVPSDISGVHSRVLPLGARLLRPGPEPPMARLEPRCRRRPRRDPERGLRGDAATGPRRDARDHRVHPDPALTEAHRRA